MKSITTLLILVLLNIQNVFAETTIKFATVAPEGSTWMDVLREGGSQITAQTNNRVVFKYYAGGVAGDEPEVLRKMRVGQLNSAGFTGVGMGEVVTEIRLMDLPFFFKNLNELDFIKEKLFSYYEEAFSKKGFIFLGWAEPGQVYIFAQKPIQGTADMKGVKMWAWEGDPLAAAMINAFNVTPINIALPDVLMALQTGMVNAVYAPPLGAIALQWHTKVKYMMSEPLTNATGGVLVTKKVWDLLSPADQKTVKSVFKASLEKLTALSRKQNAEAIDKFKEAGVAVTPVVKAGRDELSKAAEQIRPQLVGKLYTAEFLKNSEKLLVEFRGKKEK